MGKISNLLSKRFKPPTLVSELIKKIMELNICIEFVIEAGAHEGSDSILLLQMPDVRNIYCFEPNPNSFNILRDKFSKLAQKNYEIYNLGLFNKSTVAKLFFPKIDLGGMPEKNAGTSSLQKEWAKSGGEGVEVNLVSLDEFFNWDSSFAKVNKGKNGLLWLDVEGAALQALNGMNSILGQISVAKIEVEYGVQKNQWNRKNIFKVIKFMRKHNFIPISSYLHPLTRGDILFVKRNLVPFTLKLKSLILQVFLFLLYGSIYPIRAKLRK